MPIRELSLELVHDIVESYGQITKLNLSTNGETARRQGAPLLPLDTILLFWDRYGSVQKAMMRRLPAGIPDFPCSGNVIAT